MRAFASFSGPMRVARRRSKRPTPEKSPVATLQGVGYAHLDHCTGGSDTRITVTPSGQALGADVAGVDLRDVDDATLSEIKDAWREHLVLRFRGQALTDPELLGFSRLFGELDPPGPNPYGTPYIPEFPEMNVISNVKVEGKPIGSLGDGEAIWHCDMTYAEVPPRASLLHALEVPPVAVIRTGRICTSPIRRLPRT